MFSKLLANKHIVIIVLIIMLLITVGLTVDHRDLSGPEKIVKDVVSWFQGIVSVPVKAITGFFDDIHDYNLIFQENKVLKHNLNQYSQVVAELNLLKQENKSLKEMLEYKDNNIDEYKFTVAKVIARSPDTWNNMLVIDKGSNDGIKKDMPVITTKGLIGKIYSVSNFSANVQLITDIDKESFVFATIQSKPKTYGVVNGYDKVNNILRIEQVELDAKIEPGQLVITSSLGGVFPTGLVIGKVERVEEKETGGLTKNIYVKPAPDFYHLDEVLVVTETLSNAKKNNNPNSVKEEE